MSRKRYRPEEIIGKVREAFAASLAAPPDQPARQPHPVLSLQLAQEAGRGQKHRCW